MVLIGLVGRKQVGKDTAADYLCRHYGFIKYAFAQPLKQMCQQLFFLSDDQLSDNTLKEAIDPRWGRSPRQILQVVGTDMFRNHWDVNFWVDHFGVWVRQQEGAHIVVSDVRFQNEADAIKDRGGLLIQIKRGSAGTGDGHASETQNIKGVDRVIVNDGDLSKLYTQIDASMSNVSMTSSLCTEGGKNC